MTETRTLFNGHWLRIMQRGSWEYAERVNPGGAVIIVALTDADELLLVEQFRPALDCVTIEMPAGLIGDLDDHRDEGVIESARRELEEETGYVAQHIVPVMAGPSSAGMSNEIMSFVRAFGLRRVSDGGGDATESITVHHVPRAEAAEFLARKMQQGFAIDPKLYAGLYFIDHDAQGKRWAM